MIVSKYFLTLEDYIRLERVCKKFENTIAKFHYNPIPLTQITINYFSHLETLILYNTSDHFYSQITSEN
ncbi:leucine rich repeat containing protein BspA family protein, partial [Entamoeba invadens IP1]